MKTIGFPSVKKYLTALTPDELAEEFRLLFDACPDMREYLTVKLAEGGQQAILEKYKAIIAKEFYASQTSGMPGKGRLSVARKAVADFAKVSTSTTDVLDLMFFYVERLVAYVDCYGCDVASYHNSIGSMFDRACGTARKDGVAPMVRSRAQSIVESAINFGYGTADELDDIFAEHFPTPKNSIDVDVV